MLSLDTHKRYYIPSAGDKPPATYTLGEIVSMMERAGDWRADDHPLRKNKGGGHLDDKGCGMESDKHERTSDVSNDLGDVLGIRPDTAYYSRELCRRLTYAQMVDGMGPEMLPRIQEELELLL